MDQHYNPATKPEEPKWKTTIRQIGLIVVVLILVAIMTWFFTATADIGGKI